MEFTREQLEKIISEAPEGAIYWNPMIDHYATSKFLTVVLSIPNAYLGYSVQDRYKDQLIKLTDLQKQLDEMKMNEMKATEIRDLSKSQIEQIFESIGEVNSHRGCVRYNFNTPNEWVRGASSGYMGSLPHYCVKTLRAILDKMNDSQDMQSVEWENGDKCVWDNQHYTFESTSSWNKGTSAIITRDKGVTKELKVVALSSLSKPLTPEQKQAQIDEKNGIELWYSSGKTKRNRATGIPSWDSLEDYQKDHYIEWAKIIDFKGKL